MNACGEQASPIVASFTVFGAFRSSSNGPERSVSFSSVGNNSFIYQKTRNDVEVEAVQRGSERLFHFPALSTDFYWKQDLDRARWSCTLLLLLLPPPSGQNCSQKLTKSKGKSEDDKRTDATYTYSTHTHTHTSACRVAPVTDSRGWFSQITNFKNTSNNADDTAHGVS